MPSRKTTTTRGHLHAVRTVGLLAVVLPALFLLAALAVAGTLHPARPAHPATITAAVFPSPGSRFVSPRAQIAFRGIPAAELKSISVTGSRSGSHSGRILADSDGQGASFLPARAFTAGEQVTVRTSLSVLDGSGGTFSFRVAEPAGSIPYAPLPAAPRTPGDVQQFRSRADLAPAAIRMIKADGSSDDIFLAPQQGPLQNGVMIVNGRGQLVWFKAVPRRDTATDFRVQSYHGSPVLTWWQGYLGAGVGVGAGQIYDASYRRIAEVHGAGGLSADLHEFELTPQGTALITAYFPVWLDRSLGAPRREIVLDSVVQEVDIPTGLVLFQWDSLDHVRLGDSYTPAPKLGRNPFDYFHVNAARQDADGNIIISARNTWAGYKVDHRSGRVIWTLGGRRSSFRLTSSAAFAFQHDIRPLGTGDHYMTIFDDEAGPPARHRQSRLLELSLDFAHRTAREVLERDHRPTLLANYEGNLQQLPGGGLFAGWGQQPYFSQYDSRGNLVLDGRFVDQNAHYRAYRHPWTGAPQTLPAISYAGGRNPSLYVSWNGDTSTALWRVIGGSSATSMATLASAARTGFETRIGLPSVPAQLAVEALDRSGKVLATSRALTTKSAG